MEREHTNEIRLQKFLAQAGVCSRRKAEELIAAGRVSVKGRTITRLGTTVSPHTGDVSVDGKNISPKSEHITYMLYKPTGLICSASGEQGPTIYKLLPSHPGIRLFSVGRLDKDSEGLLLVTNNGDLAQQLTHPSYEHTKTYDVTIKGKVSFTQLRTLRAPMRIEGYRTRGAQVQIVSSQNVQATTLRIILKEGRSRQIRHMCAQQNLNIIKLKRIRIGQLPLGNLSPGTFRVLDQQDFKLLEKVDTLSTSRSQ